MKQENEKIDKILAIKFIAKNAMEWTESIEIKGIKPVEIALKSILQIIGEEG